MENGSLEQVSTVTEVDTSIGRLKGSWIFISEYYDQVYDGHHWQHLDYLINA